MRKGVFGFVAIFCAALALWSVWNPGLYYLGRAALFTLVGAGATYGWMRGQHGRYAFAASCLYVALVLGIAVAHEEITAPANQVESVNLFLVPLAAVFLIASVFIAVVARLQQTAHND